MSENLKNCSQRVQANNESHGRNGVPFGFRSCFSLNTVEHHSGSRFGNSPRVCSLAGEVGQQVTEIRMLFSNSNIPQRSQTHAALFSSPSVGCMFRLFHNNLNLNPNLFLIRTFYPDPNQSLFIPTTFCFCNSQAQKGALNLPSSTETRQPKGGLDDSTVGGGGVQGDPPPKSPAFGNEPFCL